MEKKKGFTIVELVVIVSILAILLAIAIPQYSLYKANIKLRAEANRLRCFLRDQQTYARQQCINVAIYRVEDYGTSMMTVPCTRKSTTPFMVEQWVSPACAGINEPAIVFKPHPDMPIASSSALKAKNAAASHLQLFQAADGMTMRAHYAINNVINFTPNGIKSEGGVGFVDVEYRMYSSSTPRVYSIYINDVGSTLVCQYDPSSPAAGADE
jgi:type II secretory pathway pseudopilin PulG